MSNISDIYYFPDELEAAVDFVCNEQRCTENAAQKAILYCINDILNKTPKDCSVYGRNLYINLTNSGLCICLLNEQIAQYQSNRERYTNLIRFILPKNPTDKKAIKLDIVDYMLEQVQRIDRESAIEEIIV